MNCDSDITIRVNIDIPSDSQSNWFDTLKQESDVVIRHSIAATKVEAINNWNKPKERITNFARLVGTLIWNDTLNSQWLFF